MWIDLLNQSNTLGDHNLSGVPKANAHPSSALRDTKRICRGACWWLQLNTWKWQNFIQTVITSCLLMLESSGWMRVNQLWGWGWWAVPCSWQRMGWYHAFPGKWDVSGQSIPDPECFSELESAWNILKRYFSSPGVVWLRMSNSKIWLKIKISGNFSVGNNKNYRQGKRRPEGWSRCWKNLTWAH